MVSIYTFPKKTGATNTSYVSVFRTSEKAITRAQFVAMLTAGRVTAN